MIEPPEENQGNTGEDPPSAPEDFDYEVVDPDLLPEVAVTDPTEALADGERRLQAIDEELASANGPFARWGAFVMMIAILLMLLLPRLGCSLTLHPYR